MSTKHLPIIAAVILGLGVVAVIIRLSIASPEQDLNLSALPGIEESTSTQSTTQPMQNNPTELQITDTKVGTGAEATAGKSITVHYVGTLLDGTKFDSSRDRGTPFTFTLGAGQVIQGWDQGFAGMKVGGMRTLVIPASLAYGDSSPSPLIPAGSALMFEVELLGVE